MFKSNGSEIRPDNHVNTLKSSNGRSKEKVHSQYRNARNGAMLVEPVSMGMRSKSVIPVRSNDCAFLFIIPGQVSVIAEFPWSY
jgi:hypothetical protein